MDMDRGCDGGPLSRRFHSQFFICHPDAEFSEAEESLRQ